MNPALAHYCKVVPVPPYRVPKTLRANIAHRRRVIISAARRPERQAAIKQRCAKDVLYWINTFGVTFDPRRTDGLIAHPFITYEFQDEALLNICAHISGQRDLLIEKSRDMGASWINLMAILWFWLFRENTSFLCVSRKEEYVDKDGDPKSMFWKLLFAISKMPPWLRPELDRKKLHLANLENGSTINGESTTGDVARGDRRTAILLDEFAAVPTGDECLLSTQDATNCLILNSTPKGVNNAFYRMRCTKIDVECMHWTRHPEKAAGKYVGTPTELKIFDEDYQYPEDFEVIRDGEIRSPWFDREEERRDSKMAIAQELNISYEGSGQGFFDAGTILKLQEEAREPLWRGNIEVDPLTGEIVEFQEEPLQGCFSMWTPWLHGETLPSEVDYILGCDISLGTGASQSVCAIVDVRDQAIVAEFVSKTLDPVDFARVCVALAERFNKGLLIWEANGPGHVFGGRVLEANYGNIFYMYSERGKRQKIPGFFKTPKNTQSFLAGYRGKLQSGKLVNPSKESLQECLEYEFIAADKVAHVTSERSTDNTGRGSNHGDRVIAAALAAHALSLKNKQSETAAEIIPANSLMARRIESGWSGINSHRDQLNCVNFG